MFIKEKKLIFKASRESLRVVDLTKMKYENIEIFIVIKNRSTLVNSFSHFILCVTCIDHTQFQMSWCTIKLLYIRILETELMFPMPSRGD